MRAIVSSILVAALAGCTLGPSGPDPDPDPDSDAGSDPDPDPSCIADAPFDPQRMARDLTYLASDELEGRAPGTEGDTLARRFIADRFACLGLAPAGPDGSYDLPFTTSKGVKTANVVGYIPGTDLAAESIVIGAHHDHLGVSGGEIYNGANDNASGVVAVLAIAQAMVQRGTRPRRTVVFATFGFEENIGPCEGSEQFAAHAPPELPIDNVVYMVNGDMLGTYSSGGLEAYGTVAGSPGRAVLDDLLGDYAGLVVGLGELPDQDDSDFQAFCDRGVPYVYFETWDESCYHQPCDDADRIDYASFGLISNLLGDVAAELADSDRDLAGAMPAQCAN